MLLKVFIIAIVLLALIMLTLGVKLLFNPDAEFTVHSCALDDGTTDENSACFKCQLKDLADCPEKKGNQFIPGKKT
jgi:hypothetical protein